MNEQKRITQWVICALKGAGITVLSGTVILLIFAWLIASGRIPEDLMEVSVLTALILASFFGGRAAVRCQGGTAGVTALVSGAVVLLGITIASAAEAPPLHRGGKRSAVFHGPVYEAAGCHLCREPGRGNAGHPPQNAEPEKKERKMMGRISNFTNLHFVL